MYTEFETENFRFAYSGLYGVCRYIRKSDNAMTPLDTGSDCQDERRFLRRLQQKTGARRYPKTAPSFAELFDNHCWEYVAAGLFERIE